VCSFVRQDASRVAVLCLHLTGLNGGVERPGSGRRVAAGVNRPAASSAATSNMGGLDGPYTGSSGGSTRAENMAVTIDDCERTQSTSGIIEEDWGEEEDGDCETGEQTVDLQQYGSGNIDCDHDF